MLLVVGLTVITMLTSLRPPWSMVPQESSPEISTLKESSVTLTALLLSLALFLTFILYIVLVFFLNPLIFDWSILV